jgi:Holliday junction resolvase RusA-like endonuclease
MKLTIPGTLPTENEIINASKAHWTVYRDLKQTHDDLVVLYARKLPELKYADYIITWYCPNKQKDKDNIIAGQKFIFDGLQKAGKIKNDGWKEIGTITHRFEVDKQNPRVEIEIIERATA